MTTLIAPTRWPARAPLSANIPSAATPTQSGLPMSASLAELRAYCETHQIPMQQFVRMAAQPSDRNVHDLLLAHLTTVDDALAFAATLERECPNCAKAQNVRHDIDLALNPGSAMHARWVIAAARRIPCAKHEAGSFALAAPTRD